VELRREGLLQLHGSFARTGEGHGTDKALVGGLLGFRPDDERLRDALQIAEREGLDYKFEKVTIADAARPQGRPEHCRLPAIELTLMRTVLGWGGVGDRHLPRTCSRGPSRSADLERITKPFVVGTGRPSSPPTSALSRAVTSAGPRKGTVKLKEPSRGVSPNQAAGEKPEPASTGGVRGGGPTITGSDYVEQGDHA